MNKMKLGICLIAVAATGCASQPPEEIPLGPGSGVSVPSAEPQSQNLVTSASRDAVIANQAPDRQSQGFPSMEEMHSDARIGSDRSLYEELSVLPPAESRALHFHLGRQTFDYFEDGELVFSGAIASGKPGSPTPRGRFSVLGKDKDKQSSLYKNEIGTQAWMPYSLQFHGNYFIHEGWLPGYAASHGCIRMGHYHARLLFERMKIGDPVTVSN